MSLIYPPWTDEQVAALNRWQACDHVHPFTCGLVEAGGKDDHGQLYATNKGWVCGYIGCKYTQNWAHDFMLKVPEDRAIDWLYRNRKKEKE